MSPVEAYGGHEVETEAGCVLSSSVREFGDEPVILLGSVSPDRDSTVTSLTPDEAFRFALGLLRDVSLARFGSG